MNKFIACVLALGLGATAWAQTEGGISGTVKDSTGAALPAASVTIKNSETGALRRLVADSAGRYSAPSLAVGAYEISAEASGFAPLV
ncbi:MAG: carboxypeptidase regulatory-like domain-containing protein [Bryobacterales bacterium]|nr:carboxypeptidase regulatory-like domain-containing protein [Bryobacterales bacterium]